LGAESGDGGGLPKRAVVLGWHGHVASGPSGALPQLRSRSRTQTQRTHGWRSFAARSRAYRRQPHQGPFAYRACCGFGVRPFSSESLLPRGDGLACASICDSAPSGARKTAIARQQALDQPGRFGGGLRTSEPFGTPFEEAGRSLTAARSAAARSLIAALLGGS